MCDATDTCPALALAISEIDRLTAELSEARTVAQKFADQLTDAEEQLESLQKGETR